MGNEQPMTKLMLVPCNDSKSKFYCGLARSVSKLLWFLVPQLVVSDMSQKD